MVAKNVQKAWYKLYDSALLEILRVVIHLHMWLIKVAI